MTLDASDLAAARAGDSSRFEKLVAPFRRELEVHCYRLTGSLLDAEDLVQESLVRAWRGLGSFEGRSSLRTWLYRIATNACLNALERRPSRELPSDRGEPGDPSAPFEEAVTEPVWLEPCPPGFWQGVPSGPETRVSARESVAIAFLAALQNLPPLQRAVLILRDVLGFSAAESAEELDTTVAAVNSALQRARATLESRHDRLEAGLLAPDDAQTEELLRRYVAAWESGDPQALAALLREDATLTMPPVPTWYRGREAICAFLAPLVKAMGSFKARAISANGLPACAVWVRPPQEKVFRAQAIQVLSADAKGIARMDVFMNPGLFPRFGLPPEIP